MKMDGKVDTRTEVRVGVYSFESWRSVQFLYELNSLSRGISVERYICGFKHRSKKKK